VCKEFLDLFGVDVGWLDVVDVGAGLSVLWGGWGVAMTLILRCNWWGWGWCERRIASDWGRYWAAIASGISCIEFRNLLVIEKGDLTHKSPNALNHLNLFQKSHTWKPLA
jgi:hypothetical protein